MKSRDVKNYDLSNVNYNIRWDAESPDSKNASEEELRRTLQRLLAASEVYEYSSNSFRIAC